MKALFWRWTMKKNVMKLGMVLLLLTLVLSGCGGGGSSSAELEEGTYSGVLIIKKAPMVEYAEKAYNDPSSLPEPSEENAETCEQIDLTDEQVRIQVAEALEKAKKITNVEVPMVVTIAKGGDGNLTATVRVDFQAAFPDYGCEAATDEPYDLTHEKGRLTMKKFTDQGEDAEADFPTVMIYEGTIGSDGTLEGEFTMDTESPDYVEYTGGKSLISGTWKVKK